MEDDESLEELYGVIIPRSTSLWSKFSRWMTAFRDKYIPYLVWYGQDVDVQVTFTDVRLVPDIIDIDDLRCEGDIDALFDAESALRRLGITFDMGTSTEGRDWEFDWSLHGPVKVQFRCRHKGGRN